MTETVKLPVARGTYEREVARIPRVPLLNRYFEANPVLTEGPVSALTRPAMKKFVEVGAGPIRALYSAPGLFDDALFVVSATFLYRVSVGGVVTLIGELSTIPLGNVSWAAVAPIGDIPAHLFIAEGGVLWVYTEFGEAQGQLEVTGALSNGDQVRIGDVYYQFATGSVDAGTPAGTLANPWLVDMNGGIPVALGNLYEAINGDGTPGTTYSTALVEHPAVRAFASGSADLFVNARDAGPAGNTIVTTETGAGMAWTSGTLTGGGLEQLRQAEVPDDSGAISIAHINSFVIVVPVQEEADGTLGKFFWINPGETYVDPIDFANAERSSDKIHQVGVFGNMFWLMGEVTTEPWQTTADPEAPMQRFQSIMFDRGSWEGTMVQVKGSLIVVDEQGGVFQIAGGEQRISRPDIEEQIRNAMLEERRLLF